MNKNYFIIGVIIVIAITAFAVIQNKNIPDNLIACTMEAKLCPDGSAVGRQGPNCEFAKCPDLPDTIQAANIKVYSPRPGDPVADPVIIVGEARVFENTFNYRVKDATGAVLGQGFNNALAPDIGQFGPFSVALSITKPATSYGTVEVFNFSAKDGSEQDVVSIPIIFDAAAVSTVQAYFSNTQADPGTPDCAKVFSVYRNVPNTQAVARAALEEMLKGPTAAEQRVGYVTGIQNGSRIAINSLTIENGVAKVDFSSELEQSAGGSCRVGAVRSQIEHTLKQFSTVKSVVISVNGESETILQP
ncbi:MAG: Gmad2 immunoglobulin-like domain-containing protein [bacterium]|nr:Gmad2 immunoglobulin-like domain-containing protein [bacterium]